MSAETFEVTASSRSATGKGDMRRLRKTGQVPGIVYGGKGEPQPIQMPFNEMIKHLEHESFYSHILELKIDGKAERVLLKDVVRHPYRLEITHVDFLRVVAGQKLTTNVPLHFINEEQSPGVEEGGVVQHQMTEVEISVLPRNLPEYIEVDIAGLALGDNLHLSDLKLPEGVELVALAHGGADRTVASVNIPRAIVEEDDDADEVEAGEVPTVGEDAEDDAEADDKKDD